MDQILSTANHLHKHIRNDTVAHLLDLVLVHKEVLNGQQFDMTIGLLNDIGQIQKSQQLLQALGNDDKRSAWSWFQQGLCEQVTGNFESAAHCHLTALEMDENLGLAAYSLSSIGNSEIDSRLFDLWKQKRNESSITEHQKAQFEFAVAREYDKRDEHDRSFASYSYANTLIAKSQPFDPEEWDTYIDETIETFNAGYFEKHKEQSMEVDLTDEQSGQQLCFIIGMPRSGSTLLEQKLAVSSSIVGLGELHSMRSIYADIPEVTRCDMKLPIAASRIDTPHIQQFRQRYLDSLPNETTSALFIDKMLGNFIRLGVLAIMFPRARVLHSCRQPMATSVSCFTNAFSSGLRFTYDLYSMGRAWRSYQRIMQHWYDVLPLDIMDVHYEKLVSAPDNYLQQIHQFLDSSSKPITNSESEQTSSEPDSAHPIRTASFWQARQAVSCASIESWKRFDPYLDRLREGLEYERN